MTQEATKSAALVELYSRVQAEIESSRLTTLAVIEARKTGASWSQVGAMLGMTPQGAWKAYHELDSEDPDQLPPADDVSGPTG